MLNFIFEAFLLATISWFYHDILKDFLFSKWFLFGYNNYGKEKYEGTWKEYIYKPIWGCQYCTSGQLALWMFFYFNEEYSLFYHISFITLTVLITKFLWKKLEQ